MRDKRDWEKYIAQIGAGNAWNTLTNQPNLSQIIQQLLHLIQQQPQQNHHDMRRGPKNMQNNQGGRKPHPNMGQRQMNPQMMNQGMNPQQMMQRMPQPNMPQPPMMQPPIQQQQMTYQQKYQQQANMIFPSVRENNPYLKDQMGHFIFDYVQMMVGQEKAPKITGMLIELPIDQIKQYLQSFAALQ